MTVLTACALLFLAYLAVVAATVVYLGRKDRARQANLDYIDHVRRDQERRLAARDDARRLERDAGEVSAWTLAGVAVIAVLAVIVAALVVLVVRAPVIAGSIVFVAALAAVGYVIGEWLEHDVMPAARDRAERRRAVAAGEASRLVYTSSDSGEDYVGAYAPDVVARAQAADVDLDDYLCVWPVAGAPCGAPAATWRARPLLEDDRLWTAAPVCHRHTVGAPR